jgi:CRP-like cAMP-binding protein
MDGEIEKVLRKTQLFATLTDTELQALAGRAKKRHFAEGALLFAEGDR